MCNCQRTTYYCQCRHKESDVERCFIYQLRQDGSCLAWCFPRCRANVRRHSVQRVCKDCESYFYNKYGPERYRRFIQLFLDYKERAGLGKTPVDPQTVPLTLLIDRQSAPPVMGAPQATTVHGVGVGVGEGRRQAARPLPPPPAHPINAPAIVKQQQQQQRSAGPKRREAVEVSDDNGATMTHGPPGSRIPRKPVPVDPSLFVVGEDADEDVQVDTKGKGKARARQPGGSPLPKYHTETLSPDVYVIPELAHLAEGSGTQWQRRNAAAVASSSASAAAAAQPRHAPTLKQPQPRQRGARAAARWRRRAAGASVASTASDASVVRRLTQMARDMDVPNIEYLEYDGKWVPRVMSPPKGRRRTRTPSPHPTDPNPSPSPNPNPNPNPNPSPSPSPNQSPNQSPRKSSISSDDTSCTSAIDIAIAANAVPACLTPGGRSRSRSPRPLSYFIVATPDANSPTGASVPVENSPSHKSVSVPPPRRLEGILIPRADDCPQHSHSSSPSSSSPSSSPSTGNASSSKGGDCAHCRGQFFKERGLPSESYVREECRSATQLAASSSSSPSPVLVAVRTPRRRYSCAVQACYCHGDGDGDLCPSCLERNKFTERLNISWV